MLTILGGSVCSRPFCDRLPRRSFLTIGGAALGGLSLPSLLRAEAQSSQSSSHKALINVFLPGGPPHQDMWDLKPEAPDEIRGEFKPISTNVSGIQIGELLPKLAGMMDKLAIIRSVVGAKGPHYALQCMTGHSVFRKDEGQVPNIGAWISRLAGPAHTAIPPNLSLAYRCKHRDWGAFGGGGFLGSAFSAYGLVNHVNPHESVKDEAALAPVANNLVLRGISLERLQDRASLLSAFDALRRDTDRGRALAARDRFTDQALTILTSSRLVEALDVSREDPKTVERYGTGIPQHLSDAAPRMTKNFLIARRLVEAGARVVSLNFSRWDWHGSNFEQARKEVPMLDSAVSALVQDLHERGMGDDVAVIVWGEFGRTPKINKRAGRDHWPAVNSALLAGGGMRTGQVIGATDAHAAAVADRPVSFGEVHATLYHCLGLDHHTTVHDSQGRPHYPLDQNDEPIAELV